MKNLSWILVCFSTFLFSSCDIQNDEKAAALNDEAVLLMDQQDYVPALGKFHAALDVDPSEELKSQIYRNIHALYSNMNVPDSAIIYSEKSFKLAETDSYLYYVSKAEYLILKGEVGKAIILFEKAMKKEPKEPETYSNLSGIYNGNYGENFINFPKALTYSLKAYKLVPNAGHEEQLANVYFQNEDYKNSAMHYLALMKKYPEVKSHQFFAGQSIYWQGKEEEGMNMMEEAAAQDKECRKYLDQILK